MSRKSLFIDTRMINSSGIGVVIRNLLRYSPDLFDVTAVCFQKDVKLIQCIDTRIQLCVVSSKCFSLSEQIELSLAIPSCDIYLSPYWNVPIFLRCSPFIITIIYDCFHIDNNYYTVSKKFIFKLFFRFVIWRSSLLLTISDFTRDRIKQLFGSSLNPKVFKISVSEGLNMPARLREDEAILPSQYLPENYILVLGNVKPHKNIKVVLEAMVYLKQYKLVIAGKIDGFREGDNSISEHLGSNQDLNDRVFLIGEFLEEEKLDLYRNARLFVFPSTYEGFGIPPLEAQIAGCPVIASNLQVLKENLRDSALYFNPHSSKDLVRQITVLEDVLEYKRYQSLGSQNASRFSWEDSMPQLMQFIRDQHESCDYT